MAKNIAPSTTAVITATVWNTFESLYIQHGALEKAHDQFDAVRLAFAKNRESNSPTRGLCIFAPSHSGKSHTIRSYVRQKIVPALLAEDPALSVMDVEDLVREQKKVVHVTLSAQATPKSLAVDILTALEDDEPDRGTKQTLWRRVHKLLKSAGTELLVIDEVQHLAHRRIRYKQNSDEIVYDHQQDQTVADTLKVMMIRGSVPIVFCGILQSRQLLFASTQFKGRVLDEIRFETLRWAVESERMEFFAFCGRLALKLKQTGLLTEEPPLVHDDVPSALYAASGGRLGLVCRIVEKATILALTSGSTTISRDHLSMAVDIVIVARGESAHNPFNNNPGATLV
ncbi:ATP-binding protein [Pelagibacterium nitratireducens]|jgi:hypothetical protein|uniref:ATP-binding protein n=1 Tax=Pelagibacterium nitratireducens TaxID=1046114 RepID=A0ABZ2I513_9HYPH|tara:strand:- start:4207 stop:5232 length:1026 start_codon:yes stop_codon:yes gene_type:complete